MLNSTYSAQEARELRAAQQKTFQQKAIRKQYGSNPTVVFVETARQEARDKASHTRLWLGATRSENLKAQYRAEIAHSEKVAEALADYRDELLAA